MHNSFEEMARIVRRLFLEPEPEPLKISFAKLIKQKVKSLKKNRFNDKSGVTTRSVSKCIFLESKHDQWFYHQSEEKKNKTWSV